MITAPKDSLYQLALEKTIAEENKLKAKEMEVLIEKQNIINEKLRNLLDIDNVESEISDEGTIEIDGVTFTLDYLIENNGLVLKAEIACVGCGEILEYKTIYTAEDIVKVYENHALCLECLKKSCEVHHRSFWERLKDFLRGY
jgi:hypothetical protein